MTGQHATLVVVHRQGAVEDLRQDAGHLHDAASVEQHVGQQVVGVGGALRGRRTSVDLGVGLVGRSDRGPRLLEQPRVLQGDRGVSGERGEQRHLRGREGADAAVHSEQGTDDLALDRERHPEDGADLLARHGGVDVVAVQEPLVGLVVLGEVRRPRLGDEAEQTGAERQPKGAELGGESTVGHLHVRRPLRLVVQREVGHVRVQELAGAPDDGGQDGVEVPDRGEVPGRLVERRQLGLATPLSLQLLVHPHREGMLPAQGPQLLRRRPGGLGLRHDHVEVLARRSGEQHLEELRGDLHGAILPVPVTERAWARRRLTTPP